MMSFDNIKRYICKNNITDHYSIIMTLNKIGVITKSNTNGAEKKNSKLFCLTKLNLFLKKKIGINYCIRMM